MAIKKNFYIVFDCECLLCNNFLKFIDTRMSNKYSNIFVVSNLEFIQNELIDKNKLNLLKQVQQKSIVLILPNKEFLLRSEAIAYIFYLSNNKFLNLISKIIKFIPLNISNFFYDLIAKYRKIFNNNISCYVYKPKNLIYIN